MFHDTLAYAIVPSWETAADWGEANGLTALMTCGSLATLAVEALTAVSSAATVPVRAWKTICPPYPPCCGQVLSSRFRPSWEPLPGTV